MAARAISVHSQVSLAELPTDTMGLLWEYAGEAVAAGITEGLARVKKCTEAGRHGMALDAATVRTVALSLALALTHRRFPSSVLHLFSCHYRPSPSVRVGEKTPQLTSTVAEQ
jgi:hypothetical protein